MIQFHFPQIDNVFIIIIIIINISSDKVCLKRFDFLNMSIVSMCCYNAFRYGYTSPAVTIQPKTFLFPQRSFDFKKPEQSSV